MRLILAIWLGKLIFFLSRLTKKGGGSAAPGLYALKICPDLISQLLPNPPAGGPQNIVITGTNGKTTTARLLSHFLKTQNLKVIRNSTGSNLARGVASTLIAHSNLLGKIQADLGIWELDEAAFNNVVFDLKPEIMVFLNAFRDQLDRYGEVDSVVNKWRQSLEKVNWDTAIIVNGGDNHTWSLAEALKQTKRYTLNSKRFYEFRVKDHQMAQERTGAEDQKHQDDFVAEITKNNGFSGLEFNLKFPDDQLKINLPIPGIYHVYDFLAAFSVYYLLNLPLKDINDHLQSYLPAFGRVEKFTMQLFEPEPQSRRPERLTHKIEAYILLIKNPAGATEVFNTLAPEITKNDRLLIALNDNFADGKDVSWIWDAPFDKLLPNSNTDFILSPLPLRERRGEGLKEKNNNKIQIICSGSRAHDLALRLKYAGVSVEQLKVENDLSRALAEAQEGLQGRLFILPTYTALLELQQLLTKAGIKKHYWRENS